MDSIDWEALKAQIEIEEPVQYETRKEYVEVDYVVDKVIIDDPSANLKDNKYYQRQRLLKYCRALKGRGLQTEEARIVYASMCKIMQDEYNEVYKMITEDIEDLDKCFNSKAYKATLILAGSILEAFLLDWLSEKDGKDYFNEPYKVQKTREDGTTFWVKDEQLCTYIDSIPELRKPEWMVENAHKIRKKRNLVHAKLCLKDDIGINEDICKEVIDSLKEIIDARFKSIKF